MIPSPGEMQRVVLAAIDLHERREGLAGVSGLGRIADPQDAVERRSCLMRLEVHDQHDRERRVAPDRDGIARR